MHKYIFGFLLLVYMENTSFQRQILIECTVNCQCDVWENLRRARCENGKMLNVLGNVPSYTEILEFSYNYVTELKNEELYNSGLSSLKLANFSHNKINEIHIYCFEKMAELQTLDLSHNALQYLLPEWFWTLPSLKELNMNNNNLGQLESRPLFTSPTLQILNLAYCQIPHIETNALLELPNLEKLDITGNYLIEISSDVIKPCENLVDIKLKHNNIECNNIGMFFTAYCMKKKIHIDNNFCKKTEDIKAIDNRNRNERIEEIRKDDVKNVWVYDIKEVEEEPETNHTSVCNKSLVLELIEMSPMFSIITLLTLGFLAGLIVGCSCNIKGQKKQRQSNFSRRYSYIRTKTLNSPGTEELMQNVCSDTQSTPIVLRRELNENLY